MLPRAQESLHTDWLNILVAQGQPAEAIRALFPAADAGDVFAQHRLAHLLAEAGRTSEACAVLHTLVEEEDPSAVELWVDIIATDDIEGTLALLRQASHAGNTSAAGQMARLLADRGLLNEAVEVLRAIDEGSARHRLFRLLADAGAHADALAVARTMIEAGDYFGAEAIAEALAATRDETELTRLLEAGTGEAAVALAQIWITDGRESDAIALLHSAAVHGSSVAYRAWIAYLAAAGRTDEADRLRRYGLTAQGDIAASLNLPKPHYEKRLAAAHRVLANA